PSDDPIERIGVERSRAAATSADLLLLVLDSSAPLTNLDIQAAAELRELITGDSETIENARPVILLLNKADLPVILDGAQASELWPEALRVRTSATTREGLEALEETIAQLVLGGQAAAGNTLVSSARHRDALRRADDSLRAAATTLDNRLP